MKKRYVNLILAMASASVLVLGSVPAMAKTDETKTESGEEAEASEEKDTDAAKADTLEDGVYTAEFGTDSSMFHVNEANDKKGELTVKDGKMTIHVSLVSKKIVNLFAGTAEQDSKKDHKQDTKSCDDTCKHKFFHMKNDNSGFCTHLLPPFPALVYSMQGISIHAFNFKLPIGINFSKCIKNSKSG